MNCIKQIETIDAILNSFKDDLGKSFEQYRNHVYRVYNFAIPYLTVDMNIANLQIATAFHDIGIWTNKTFNYINPSIELANKYCSDINLDKETISEIQTIISEHHKLTKVKTSKIAEIFRNADLVDLSLGLIRYGRDKNHIKLIKKSFPNRGFHLLLFKLFCKNLLKNPMKPLPMYKF